MNTELFIDGEGKHVEVHERNASCDVSCCIHNPSDHPLKDAPLVWRVAGVFDIKPSHMERRCEHGVGHPDPDGLSFLRRTGQEKLADDLAVHGCDGCCSGRNLQNVARNLANKKRTNHSYEVQVTFDKMKIEHVGVLLRRLLEVDRQMRAEGLDIRVDYSVERDRDGVERWHSWIDDQGNIMNRDYWEEGP